MTIANISLPGRTKHPRELLTLSFHTNLPAPAATLSLAPLFFEDSPTGTPFVLPASRIFSCSVSFYPLLVRSLPYQFLAQSCCPLTCALCSLYTLPYTLQIFKFIHCVNTENKDKRLILSIIFLTFCVNFQNGPLRIPQRKLYPSIQFTSFLKYSRITFPSVMG